MPSQVLISRRAPLSLPQVTLAAVTSIAPLATARAISLSCADVAFGSVLWISDLPPPTTLPKEVVWHRIAPLTSREDYSRFVLSGLAGLIETDHVLVVQWDGYVLDASQWDPRFLDYDYIGPVWPQFATMTVGNGGFSLRSRSLLQACLQVPVTGVEAEDIFICRTLRPLLERGHGITFAPPEVAGRFAFERERAPQPTFGFHGVFNLVELASDKEVADLLAELPLRSLSRGELRELLRWSLMRFRWRIVVELLRRWRRWL